MSGNSFEHNILISVSGGGGYKRVSGSPLNSPMIADNAYHSYAGAPVSFTGRYTDVGPISEDPQLSGWTYNVAPDSPVFKSPVSFPGIVGGWGPPGFVVPQTGTPPSSPH